MTPLKTITWPSKSPTEVKDYGINWKPGLLPNETIMVSTWETPDGILVQSYGLDETDPKVTVIWLSGGVATKSYKFMNRISTSQGRILEASAILTVRAR